jgi:hypothetical protein
LKNARLILGEAWWVRWPVLVCLLFNPMLYGHDSLYRLSPQLANVFVMPVLLAVQPVLLPLAVTAAVLYAGNFWMRRNERTELWAEKRPRMAAWLALGAIFAGFEGWAMLVPPLATAALGAMAATPAYTGGAKWMRMVLVVALWAIGIEFLFSMSLDSFAAVAEVNR